MGQDEAVERMLCHVLLETQEEWVHQVEAGFCSYFSLRACVGGLGQVAVTVMKSCHVLGYFVPGLEWDFGSQRRS